MAVARLNHSANPSMVCRIDESKVAGETMYLIANEFLVETGA